MAKAASNLISPRVGLDIGSHTINGVEVAQRGAELVIRSAGSESIGDMKCRQSAPEPGVIVRALRDLWDSSGFASKRVILALPPESVYVKWLHLEAASEEELEQTARAAATRGAPFPASDAVVDYRVLSSRGSSTRNVHFVMLIAASGDAIDELLNIAETSGLEPLAVDYGTAAVVRSIQTQKKSAGPLWSGQPCAHCQIGARTTTISVVRGGELEFARAVPVGGNDLTECIVQSTGMNWAEAENAKMSPDARLMSGGILVASSANGEIRVPCENAVGRLAREMQRSLKFFRSQFAEGSYLGMIGSTTLSGGGSLVKGIDLCLQEQGVEVSGIANPFAGFSVAAESRGIRHIGSSAAAYTQAVGLALGDYWSHREDEPVSEAA